MILGSGVMAATFTVGLDTEYSGGQAPASATTPWVTATFDDSLGGPNTVRLLLEATNLTDREAIKVINFNFDPNLDPTLLTVVVVSAIGTEPTAYAGVDSFKAAGAGSFDIQFRFPPSPGGLAARFTANETAVCDLIYLGGPIDVTSFDFHSAAQRGQTPFRSAAQVLDTTGPGKGGGGWIGQRD